MANALVDPPLRRVAFACCFASHLLAGFHTMFDALEVFAWNTMWLAMGQLSAVLQALWALGSSAAPYQSYNVWGQECVEFSCVVSLRRLQVYSVEMCRLGRLFCPGSNCAGPAVFWHPLPSVHCYSVL